MNYKEPVNGKFGDCTKDILKELGGEESDDENEDDLVNSVMWIKELYFTQVDM